VVAGLVVTIWACLRSNTVIQGVEIGLESPFRYVVLAVGLVVVAFGILLGLISVGVVFSGTKAPQIPATKIAIGSVQRTDQPPHARYMVSGDVEPKQSGITVWLVRERQTGRTGEYMPSPYPATTDDSGHWQQAISMWPGRFRIHTIVTTDQNGDFYRWYGRAREAALKIVQRHDSGSNDVPGWPTLDALPEPRVSDDYEIDV